MSLIVLDEQLDFKTVGVPLAKHFAVKRLQELRPGEQVLDAEGIFAVLSTTCQHPPLTTLRPALR